MAKRATIYDLASQAGVSFSTAALALRSPNRVAAKTRQKVLDAANSLNYQRDVYASALARGKSKGRLRLSQNINIAFVTLEVEEARNVKTIYEAEVFQCANEFGYDCERIELTRDAYPQRALDAFYARGGNALIIGPMRSFPRLDLHRFAVVRLSQVLPPFAYDAVDHAVFHETLDAFQKLRELGFMAIGVASHSHTPRNEDDDARTGAVLAAQARLGLQERKIPPLQADHRDHKAFEHWLRRHCPDAVLGFSSGDYHFLRSLGYKIPAEIGFASLHVRASERQFSGVLLEYSVLVQSAFEILNSRIYLRQFGPPEQVRLSSVMYPWNPGTTLLSPAEKLPTTPKSAPLRDRR